MVTVNTHQRADRPRDDTRQARARCFDLCLTSVRQASARSAAWLFRIILGLQARSTIRLHMGVQADRSSTCGARAGDSAPVAPYGRCPALSPSSLLGSTSLLSDVMRASFAFVTHGFGKCMRSPLSWPYSLLPRVNVFSQCAREGVCLMAHSPCPSDRRALVSRLGSEDLPARQETRGAAGMAA